MDYPESRSEAKQLGAKYYFTGVPCTHGHIALRKTKGACVECLKVEWKNNLVKRASYYQAYNRSEAGKEAKSRYYEENRDEVIQRAALRPPEEKRKSREAWKRANPDKVQAHTKSRRRKHRNATPKWLSAKQRNQMREMYRIARTSTQITGVQYVVDHIVPLRGTDVWGLHVPWNLRVITQDENLRKSNTFLDTPAVV